MEKQSKNSRQRNAVLHYLQNTTAHPTAQELYTMVQKDIPNISLATVYRNLNLLCEDGRAVKLTVSGAAHFDATVQPHTHFLCTSCGRMTDVELPHGHELNQTAQSLVGGTVDGHSLIFYGSCPACCTGKLVSIN